MSDQKAVSYRRSGTIGSLSIRGVADIFEAVDIHLAAVKALDDVRAATVRVDLANLEHMDLSTVQTLRALRRDLESSGRNMEIARLSEPEAAGWNRIGLEL
jgi:anti-anti-sigma regulatory factor